MKKQEGDDEVPLGASLVSTRSGMAEIRVDVALESDVDLVKEKGGKGARGTREIHKDIIFVYFRGWPEQRHFLHHAVIMDKLP